ncbi:MAG: type II secretion system F family protein [Pirellulales bacterium]
MSPLLISALAFVGVAALVGGLLLVFRGGSESAVEDRLDVLTGAAAPRGGKNAAFGDNVLTSPLDETLNPFVELVGRFFNVGLLLEQADMPVTATKFLSICGGLGLGGALIPILFRAPAWMAPLAGIAAAVLPLFWVILKRRRRLKKFGGQMPDAMELIARALRSGHSLASGFNLVSSEMNDPIATEFTRVYEEQNLGIPLEEALQGMAERIPNLDLKFFATAVILQRQTGGDLAEILDKIGHLVRERFKIYGQVQALTGEGRLSGIVLLALPPVLFLAVYKLNPEYISVLFTDTLGKQMLAVAAVMQFLGAVVIRKIINIKV